jgi:acyl-CoA synthetase (NDP forming)
MDFCLRDPQVDGLMAVFGPMYAAGSEETAAAVVSAASRTAKPVIAAWLEWDPGDRGGLS